MMEPSLPDQDGDAADHDGDAADDVHHPLGEKHHYKAGLVFRDAPEDLGAGPVPQWVEGGLHGQGDGSKQVPQGGVYGTSNVLEIEDLDILNVPICWPGVSQDRTWKTTDVIPPSFSLATAVSSWPEQFRVSHVSKRSMTFCIAYGLDSARWQDDFIHILNILCSVKVQILHNGWPYMQI